MKRLTIKWGPYGSSVNMPRFGEKLRALRLRQGLTLRELAIVLGYRNFGYLALLESGKKEPTLELVMKVAQYFEVTTDQLVWDHLQLDDNGHSPTLPDTDDTSHAADSSVRGTEIIPLEPRRVYHDDISMSGADFIPPRARRFGEKLRALRQHHGMTIQQLTYAIGYSGHGYISELENGKKPPTVDVLLRIAQLFHISIDQLLLDNLELDLGSAPTNSNDTP